MAGLPGCGETSSVKTNDEFLTSGLSFGGGRPAGRPSLSSLPELLDCLKPAVRCPAPHRGFILPLLLLLLLLLYHPCLFIWGLVFR